MSEIPKVSVIIPIYRVEPYIERCVRSLMEQTMRECIEFIFINDATPDGSMRLLKQVLDDYPARASQIRIINHNENKGIAYTRSEGIKEAKGQYIGWCDSDDWCEPDMFQKMYDFAVQGQHDIVTCDFFEDGNGISTIMPYGFDYVEGREYIKNFYKRRSHVMFLWRKLIRRSLLIMNEIVPYPRVNISEDLNVCLRAIYYSKSIGILHIPLYHHNICNQNAITRTANNNYIKWKQQKRNVELLSSFLSKTGEDYALTSDFIKFCIKSECRPCLPTLHEYYYTFRECHKNIMKFSGLGTKMIRFKTCIIHSSFLLYTIYELFRKRQNKQ